MKTVLLFALGALGAMPAFAAAPNTVAVEFHKPAERGGEWDAVAEETTFPVAIIRKWPGTEQWTLYFSNGTREGAVACEELSSPTGDYMLSLILEGAPDRDAFAKLTRAPGLWAIRGGFTDVVAYKDAYNSVYPLKSLDQKEIVVDHVDDEGMILGEVAVSGESDGRRYRMTGRFRARLCE